jgi:predicted small secreted protein
VGNRRPNVRFLLRPKIHTQRLSRHFARLGQHANVIAMDTAACRFGGSICHSIFMNLIKFSIISAALAVLVSSYSTMQGHGNDVQKEAALTQILPNMLLLCNFP